MLRALRASLFVGCSLLLTITFATPAWGENEDDSIRLSSLHGLTGFQGMIDARVPKGMSARGGLRYFYSADDRRFDVRPPPFASTERRKIELHEPRAWGGVSSEIASIRFDLGASLAYRYTRIDDPFATMSTRSRSQDDIGDVDLAAKLALPTLGYDWIGVAFALYTLGRVPTANEDVEGPAQLEGGLAATFYWVTPLGGDFTIGVHLNAGPQLFEGGTQAARYRGGISLSCGDSRSLRVRLYTYGSGLEYEGADDSDIDLEGGVQLLIARFFTFEVGGSYRLHSSGFRDPVLKRRLRLEPNDYRRADDHSATFQVAVGVAF